MLFANLPLSRQIKSARQHILADLRKGINLFVPPFPPARGRPFRSVSVFTIPPSILFDLNNFSPGSGRPFRSVSVFPSPPPLHSLPGAGHLGPSLAPLSSPFSRLVVCLSLSFLGLSSCLRTGRRDRSKVIAPCSARSPWTTHNSWLFSRPRLAVDGLTVGRSPVPGLPSSSPVLLVRRVGHYLPLRPLSHPVFADGGWLSGQPQRSHHASHHSPSSI